MVVDEDVDSGLDAASLLQDLQNRADQLLKELRAYQRCLNDHNKEKEVELRTFKRGVESEVKTLSNASAASVAVPVQSHVVIHHAENTSSSSQDNSGHDHQKEEDEEEDYDDNDNLDKSEHDLRRFHALRSSNLPFYEAVWNVACQNKGIIALGKRVHCSTPGPRKSIDIDSNQANSAIDPRLRQNSDKKKNSANVDIVANDGLLWIKVSTITDKRLLFEIAKEGWEGYGDTDSSSDEDRYSDTSGEDRQRDNTPGFDSINNDLATGQQKNLVKSRRTEKVDLELVKLAKILIAVSRETRVQFQHPTVQFVLPNIHEGLFDDVDAVISDLRSVGVDVVCREKEEGRAAVDDDGPQLQSTSANLRMIDPSPPDFISLLPSPSSFHPEPTQILNIDCTILLSLVSDISHVPPSSLCVPPRSPSAFTTTTTTDNNYMIERPSPALVSESHHYHKAITRQIDAEGDSTSGPLLPGELYPLLSGRDLVCTKEAAGRMREIVQTMGTVGERIRALILLGEGVYSPLSSSFLSASIPPPCRLIEALRQNSCHDIPKNLRLPITVVNFEYDNDDDPRVTGNKDLNPMIANYTTRLLQKLHLSPINKSVFLYGWHHNLVTVTSNRTVALGLVKCLNEILNEDESTNDDDAAAAAAFSATTATTTEHNSSDVDANVTIWKGTATEKTKFQGPKIYVCDTARSLVGKEKQGGGGTGAPKRRNKK